MNCPILRLLDEQYNVNTKVPIDQCTGFEVENKGNTKIWLGFDEGSSGRTIDVLPAESRTFPGSPGAVFMGEMKVTFDASEVPDGVDPVNLCLVIKQVLITK